jgi:hypothetical protein
MLMFCEWEPVVPFLEPKKPKMPHSEVWRVCQFRHPCEDFAVTCTGSRSFANLFVSGRKAANVFETMAVG